MSQKSENEESSDPILDAMMERRTVVLGGDITLSSTSDVAKRLISLQMLSNDTINLIIDSSGGSLDAALRLCDLMTVVLTAPVRGIALGQCGSSATFIMLHCSERLGTPYSRFLIHSGTTNQIAIPMNHTTSENLEQLLREANVCKETLTQLYMKHLTPVTWTLKTTNAARRAFVQKLIARGDQKFDDHMSAEEAVKVGLIERVVHEKLDIFNY